VAELTAAASCKEVLTAGIPTVLWLGLSGLLGIVAGIRAAKEAPVGERTTIFNWLALFAILTASAGGFAYIAAAPDRRCSTPMVEIFFWTQPFILGAFLGPAVWHVWLLRRERPQRR
jgi:hypothetical protein